MNMNISLEEIPELLENPDLCLDSYERGIILETMDREWIAKKLLKKACERERNLIIERY